MYHLIKCWLLASSLCPPHFPLPFLTSHGSVSWQSPYHSSNWGRVLVTPRLQCARRWGEGWLVGSRWILELSLCYWTAAGVYWMTGTLSMKDSVLATLANSRANKLKIMSKIIYMQDLFCLLFDFKVFFFFSFIFGLLCYMWLVKACVCESPWM